jgi:hypothetical protein
MEGESREMIWRLEEKCACVCVCVCVCVHMRMHTHTQFTGTYQILLKLKD